MIISLARTILFSLSKVNGCKQTMRIHWRVGSTSRINSIQPLCIVLRWYHSIPTVINTGKAYGAHPEDVYGCLYFFLSEQLRTFATRLRTFSSSFTVVPVNPRRLPIFVKEEGLSEYKTPRKFDRVDVANTLDTNQVGLHEVLTLWAPLLEDNPHATIIGHFTDWMALGQAERASSRAGEPVEGLTKQVMEEEQVRLILPHQLQT